MLVDQPSADAWARARKLRLQQQQEQQGGETNQKASKVQNNILVTHKKTMVESPLPAITSYEQANQMIGEVAHGFVTNVCLERGVAVTFYNNVFGWVTTASLRRQGVNLESLSALKVVHEVGSVVRAKILDVKFFNHHRRPHLSLTFNLEEEGPSPSSSRREEKKGKTEGEEEEEEGREDSDDDDDDVDDQAKEEGKNKDHEDGKVHGLAAGAMVRGRVVGSTRSRRRLVVSLTDDAVPIYAVIPFQHLSDHCGVTEMSSSPSSPNLLSPATMFSRHCEALALGFRVGTIIPYAMVVGSTRVAPSELPPVVGRTDTDQPDTQKEGVVCLVLTMKPLLIQAALTSSALATTPTLSSTIRHHFFPTLPQTMHDASLALSSHQRLRCVVYNVTTFGVFVRCLGMKGMRRRRRKRRRRTREITGGIAGKEEEEEEEIGDVDEGPREEDTIFSAMSLFTPSHSFIIHSPPPPSPSFPSL